VVNDRSCSANEDVVNRLSIINGDIDWRADVQQREDCVSELRALLASVCLEDTGEVPFGTPKLQEQRHYYQ
jgi:hypothetical protein